MDNPWSWFRSSWNSASTGVRVLLAAAALLFVGTGLFLFWVAWTVWQRRDDNLGKGLAALAAILGAIWLGNIASSALSGESPDPVPLAAVVDQTTTTEGNDPSTTSTAPPTTTSTTLTATTTTLAPQTTTTVRATVTSQPTTTSTSRATTTSKATTTTSAAAPSNPGDSKNCGDFATWREAQDWFERYFPHYGDVAGLDRDDDRIACESLPGAP